MIHWDGAHMEKRVNIHCLIENQHSVSKKEPRLGERSGFERPAGDWRGEWHLLS